MKATDAMTEAYAEGSRAGEGFPSLPAFWAAVGYGDADAPDYLGEPTSLLGLCWEAGFMGESLPRWVRAVRIGRIPAAGRSFNSREQQFEPGVSVLHLSGADRTDVGTYDKFNFGDRVEVEGWLHFRRGADGEPLLLGAREVSA